MTVHYFTCDLQTDDTNLNLLFSKFCFNKFVYFTSPLPVFKWHHNLVRDFLNGITIGTGYPLICCHLTTWDSLVLYSNIFFKTKNGLSILVTLKQGQQKGFAVFYNQEKMQFSKLKRSKMLPVFLLKEFPIIWWVVFHLWDLCKDPQHDNWLCRGENSPTL